jgi:23S rRNA pseudouridine955/2504/2580 synthase
MSKGSKGQPGPGRGVPVLFQDDALLVVDKPAGLPMHGGAKTQATLIDVLDSELGLDLLFPVHRLDRATSGCVLVAKTAEIARRLGETWARVEKHYLAISLGAWSGPAEIVAPVRSSGGEEQTAKTELLSRLPLPKLRPRATVLSLALRTGRMHQIRQQLQRLGHPILLDDKYGDFAANRTLLRAGKEAGVPLSKKRLLLHARRLSFPHPEHGRAVVVESPLPEHWTALIEWAEGSVDAVSQLH